MIISFIVRDMKLQYNIPGTLIFNKIVSSIKTAKETTIFLDFKSHASYQTFTCFVLTLILE